MFVSILRDIHKEETVEYVLALIDEMLEGTCLQLLCVYIYIVIYVFH